MANFRFIHSADLHIDSPFYGLTNLPKNIYEEIRASTFSAFDRIIDYCIDYAVDFLLLSGDIYDLEDRSLKAQIHFLQGLERLDKSGIKTYIIHGNHDPIDQQKAHINWPESVHIFSAKNVEAIPHYKENKEVARILGRSYPTKAFKENITSQYIDYGPAFNIGLLHTNVDGNPAHDAYAPSSLFELKNSSIDFWALGHIHKANVISEKEPTIIYPGNPQGRHIKETGLKGSILVDVINNKVEAYNWLPTSMIIWDEIVINISNKDSFNEIINTIEEAIDERLNNGQTPFIFRINLLGSSNLHFELIKEGKAAELQDIINNNYSKGQPWVWIEKIKLNTSPYISLEALLEQETFLADFMKELEASQNDHLDLEMLIGELLQNRKLKRHFSSLSKEDYEEIYKDVVDLVTNFFVKEGHN